MRFHVRKCRADLMDYNIAHFYFFKLFSRDNMRIYNFEININGYITPLINFERSETCFARIYCLKYEEQNLQINRLDRRNILLGGKNIWDADD